MLFRSYAWGSNVNGQFGNGTTTRSTVPTVIPAPTRTTALGGTGAFFIGLKDDGTVWASGANSFGELGDGTTTDRSTAMPVKGLNGVGVLSNIILISNSRGGNHSLAIDSTGKVWAWGYNVSEQCGVATSSGEPRRIITPVVVSFPVAKSEIGRAHV